MTDQPLTQAVNSNAEKKRLMRQERIATFRQFGIVAEVGQHPGSIELSAHEAEKVLSQLAMAHDVSDSPTRIDSNAERGGGVKLSGRGVCQQCGHNPCTCFS